LTDSYRMSEERQKTVGEFLDRLADESGLAVVVIDEDSREISLANNNSICGALYNSEEFAPHCARFCGKAFEMATEAGKAVDYECFAGLECRVAPVTDGERRRAVITGRAFVKLENYRIATGRVVAGDWQQFDPGEFFENVLIGGSFSTFEKLSNSIERAGDAEKDQILGAAATPVEKVPEKADSISAMIDKFHQETTQEPLEEPFTLKKQEPAEITAWRSLFGSLLRLSYPQARVAIFDYLSTRYGLISMTWFEHIDDRFENMLATGTMKNQPIRLKISPTDARLLNAARNEKPLEVKSRRLKDSTEFEILSLFPIAVGSDIRCALAIADEVKGSEIRHQLARFCQSVAPELEILRLREELSQRSWLTKAVRKFNENLKKVDFEDFWLGLTQISAEMLQAERASLLVSNTKADGLLTKASIGIPSKPAATEPVGQRIANRIFEQGRPLLVSNIGKINLKPAPGGRKYKTDSFLSYPLAIGGRQLAVLNFSDKVDGRMFEESDLELLHSIAPQMALAIDRAMLKDKAGEYEQLSVTDALTGLLNRRYLEERLTEEIKRSNRHGYPMSFMMIDVDDFKTYNDSFGHPEGDKVLKMVGHVLRDTLRGADVAARYGGEEFSILLPQTTSEEGHTIAERIRARIEETDFINRVVTVSIGIASCSLELNSADDLIAAADKALYEAKRLGRNNVKIYEGLEVVTNGP
jgi:diguanylate cyclase (GGDEF)-like protein